MKTVGSVLGCIFSSIIVAIRRLLLSKHSGTFMIIYDPYKQKMLILYISIKKGESTTTGK